MIRYEINTGIRRVNRLQQIEKWNNAKTLKAWKKDINGAPSGCQFINGTDSTSGKLPSEFLNSFPEIIYFLFKLVHLGKKAIIFTFSQVIYAGNLKTIYNNHALIINLKILSTDRCSCFTRKKLITTEFRDSDTKLGTIS